MLQYQSSFLSVGSKEINAVWLADLTYIRVGDKWCYLAGILDLARVLPQNAVNAKIAIPQS